MSKLLRSNFSRLIKNKVFYIMIAVTCIMNISGILDAQKTKDIYFEYYNKPMTLDMMLWTCEMFIGVAIAIFISLYIGTEYSDGTLRNKLIVGCSRTKIYLANFITASIGSVFIFIFSSIVSLIAGIPLLGELVMSTMEYCMMLFTGIMFCIAYAAIFNMLAILISSKAYGSVINIVFAFGLIFFVSLLYDDLSEPEMLEAVRITGDNEFHSVYEPNPTYITGTKRVIYQFLYDFIPTGQAVQFNMAMVNNLNILPIYSLIIIVFCNIVGVIIFNRKDIK